MSDSLAEFLTEKSADVDTLQQAMRYVLAVKTNDLSPQEMRQRLLNSIGNANSIDECLETLERSPEIISEAALVVLSASWHDPEQREIIAGAIEGAKIKAPVIEVGILAIVAMYGMWLYATNGVKTKTITHKSGEDGSEEYTERTDYWEPQGPISKVVDLISGKG